MKTWMIRGSLALLASCLAGVLVWRYSQETADEVFHLPVNGAEILVEQFRPSAQEASPSRFPAIVMLHGMDGAEKYGRYYREYARALADEGFQVFYVHYFDGSGYESLLELSGEDLSETILSDRGDWIDLLAQTVGQIGEREDVDPKRIGLLGFSLGGFVSLAATEKLVRDQDGPKVACVVEFFAGLFEDGHGNSVVSVEHFPPTLILHGELDERVPIRKARELEEKFTAALVPYEIQTYPDKGHGILGDDAGQRTIAFFKKHLQRNHDE